MSREKKIPLNNKDFSFFRVLFVYTYNMANQKILLAKIKKWQKKEIRKRT